MEKFKMAFNSTQTQQEERVFKVINWDHGIPVWLFGPRRKFKFGSEKVESVTEHCCAICKETLSLIDIPNGGFRQVKHCTVIQTEDGATYPMHKHCFEQYDIQKPI